MIHLGILFHTRSPGRFPNEVAEVLMLCRAGKRQLACADAAPCAQPQALVFHKCLHRMTADELYRRNSV